MERDVSSIKANRGENAILLNDGAGINGISNISDYINVSSDADEDLVPDGSRVYLTFDDGPSLYTDEVLDILDKYDAKACFFVVGTEGFDSELQRIVKDGHTIGVHSFTHNYAKIYSSEKAFKKDVQLMSDKIFVTTGVRTKLYRFPGGSSNKVSNTDMTEYIQYLNSQGITYYDWNVSCGDATSQAYTADELVENVMGDVVKYKTSVVLLHDADSKTQTVQALPKLIESLQSVGAMILPISDDTTVIQHVSLQTDLN
jgi:peptidoglycan/xylan/chitin deacetylase (PgdA/CDA1 family)